ncbi:hypothetical protein ACP70R_046273 [Stipagrostis hirtigluma subsp. patula]
MGARLAATRARAAAAAAVGARAAGRRSPRMREQRAAGGHGSRRSLFLALPIPAAFFPHPGGADPARGGSIPARGGLDPAGAVDFDGGPAAVFDCGSAAVRRRASAVSWPQSGGALQRWFGGARVGWAMVTEGRGEWSVDLGYAKLGSSSTPDFHVPMESLAYRSPLHWAGLAMGLGQATKHSGPALGKPGTS